MHANRIRLIPVLLAVSFLSTLHAQTRPASIEPQRCLVLPSTGGGGRSPIVVDTLELARVRGTLARPADGDPVDSRGRQLRWRALDRDADGTFRARELAGGWAWFTIESESRRTVLLDASGHGMVYVNGVPRAGDPYSAGELVLPIELQPGTNDLLFAVGRGQLRVNLTDPAGPLVIPGRDVTLPDLVIGERDTLVKVGLPVLNTTSAPITPTIRVAFRTNNGPWTDTPVRTPSVLQHRIPALGSRKLPVSFVLPEVGEMEIEFRIAVGHDDAEVTHTFKLQPVRPTDARRITFVSRIDGSVQYYAVQPASDPAPGKALVLSLHGASVEAISQARAYAPKSWAHIVCPTNRRPFGFDWEDWGRLDALEVLEDAARRFHTDPTCQYLTGHSMGGHGTWQLGVHHADRFAVIAPSAGWISFQSYAAARGSATQPTTQPTTRPTTPREVLRAASLPSDTLAFSSNLCSLGIYILHGDADDNVPASEARTMAEHLKTFHDDWRMHLQPGAGHWWDNDDAPGAACVDWVPMFELFQRRRLPVSDLRHERYLTTLGEHGTIARALAPIDNARPAAVDLLRSEDRTTLTGTTDNIAAIELRSPGLRRAHLDGTTIEFDPPIEQSAVLAHTSNGWSITDAPAASALRGFGGFKTAFDNRFVLVLQPTDDDVVRQLALDVARYHAETWQVRGNGSVAIMTADEFDAVPEPKPTPIRYGPSALHDRLGAAEGDVLLARLSPADGSGAVIAFDDAIGARFASRLPLFISGVHYPDFTLISPAMLESGIEGVRRAGFYDLRWQIPEPAP